MAVSRLRVGRNIIQSPIMKKAFTLIELLVVIAIIAILAAILFPVFAQAKAAAKKTSALSSQKQIGTAIVIYTTDYDDVYPRNDECVINSSLNSALNNGVVGTTDPQTKCQFSGGSFAWRMNHFSWQKWIMPYTKSVDLFVHTGRGRSDATDSSGKKQWSDYGQLANSFALNTSITGALNTGDIPMATQRVYRDSWVGGNQTALPDPSATALLLESVNPTSAIVGQGILNGNFTDSRVTVYPAVWREVLINDVYGKTGSGCNGVPGAGEPVKSFGGGMVIGFADSSAKFMKIGAIAAKTPTANEMVPGWAPTQCTMAGSTQRLGPSGNVTINTNINYPFWGFSAQ